jgi:hypothetical protein
MNPLKDGAHYYIKLNHSDNGVIYLFIFISTAAMALMEYPYYLSIKNHHAEWWTSSARHRYHVARDIGKAE